MKACRPGKPVREHVTDPAAPATYIVLVGFAIKDIFIGSGRREEGDSDLEDKVELVGTSLGPESEIGEGSEPDKDLPW